MSSLNPVQQLSRRLPSVVFRKARLEEKYGKEEAKKRIYATTDKATRRIENRGRVKKGFETFVIPDDVGGRYSVLTAVGFASDCSQRC